MNNIEYVFNDKNNNQIYRSRAIKDVLTKFRNQLKLSNLGISFLLQNGVTPAPNTIFKDLYIEGFGIKVNNFSTDKEKLEYESNFPVQIGGKNKPDEEKILELIKDSAEKQFEKKDSFLFHSAGKDSNMIALALAKSDFKDNITFITQSYSGISQLDESTISKDVAKKLGFNHLIIPDNILFEENDLNNFFYEQPFPCLDNMSLVYSNYSEAIGLNKNIIDGMGNDIYLGHMSGYKEFLNQFLFSKINFLRDFLNFPTISFRNFKLKTRSEFTGFYGFSEKDSKKIFKDFIDVNYFWRDIDNLNKNTNFELLRSKTRGIFLDNEMFIRKVRNFCDAHNHNLVLPFYSKNLVEYMTSLDKKYLYNSFLRKNKIIFRNILKDKLNLNYDLIKKRSLEYNFDNFIFNQRDLIEGMISQCSLFDAKFILDNLYKNLKHKKYSNVIKFLIIRLYLLTGWLNKSKYINRN